MEIKISQAHDLLMHKVILAGIERKDAKFIVDCYIESELTGRASHGVSKLLRELKHFSERQGNPMIVDDKNAIASVDANKEIGELSARFCIEESIKRASKYGISFVSLSNTQRIGSLGPLVRLYSDNGMVGILSNSSESVASPGVGFRGFLGTNPLAIAIPDTEPIIIDFATAKKAMADTWQKKMNSELLPNETYLDSRANYTTSPNDASYVEIFGGVKGFGLSLFIEIMTASFSHGKVGSKKSNKYDIGYLFIAIDPSTTSSKNIISQNISILRKDARKAAVDPSAPQILFPGDHARALRIQNETRGTIIVSEETYSSLL
jgi:ureidoglycolate dehydrogenase (NAD+)